MNRTVNCITVNTDASFHPNYKTAGYAFYIICDFFKIQKGGNFKRKITSAKMAETFCIGNALATLLAQKELPSTMLIIVNCDCKFAMHEIQNRTSQSGTLVASYAKKLKKRMPRGCVVDYRYVKAHNGSPDSRSWVNEWCDTEAKKWQRKATASVMEKRGETHWTKSNN